ncbi:MAG TPA: SAM-dependent methyltransferase [Xanthobacteraceae bacterium]|nr:SAM-dependent methyltransferase [Xanthobacteraceae bacterium]
MGNLTGYLAAEGFADELRRELGSAVVEVHGRLVLASGAEKPAAWAANVWLDPVQIRVASIGDAAKKLRGIQRNWALYSYAQHRRAALIAERLPKVSAKPLVFGAPAPTAPLGSWSLIASDMLIASPTCTRPFPNGEAQFVEDRSAPSRAYLKLWELFTLTGVRPQAGEVCLDLGASPGGWTWVLQRLGARVISVDKAALDSTLAGLAGITYRRQSAFALTPQEIGPVDWLFSDVICYPKRLLALVHKWREAGTVGAFVCTLKFQGATDFDAMQGFAAIPNSRLLHLSHNKHELTWIHPATRFRANAR